MNEQQHQQMTNQIQVAINNIMTNKGMQLNDSLTCKMAQAAMLVFDAAAEGNV